MANKDDAMIIKKYANRRLYNTGTSSYVTLEDLAEMVRKGEHFIVNDAKTGDDITHSVLTQIIFEQEAKTGNTLLPVSFLRHLISFYGDQMQMVVPSYLEHSISALAAQQEQFKEHLGKTMDANPMVANMTVPIQLVEEQVKRNTELFHQAMSMFSPFGSGLPKSEPKSKTTTTAKKKENAPSGKDDNEIEGLKAQLADLKNKIDKIT